MSIGALALALLMPVPVAANAVTLRADGIPLSKALAAVADKTGIAVNAIGDDDPALQLDLKDATFWQAIDAIAVASGRRVALSSREGKVSLVKGPKPADARISYSGPFRIALKRITVSRDLESGVHGATAGLEVAWEPPLQPLFLETRPQNLVVKDGRGNELAGHGGGSSVAPVDGRIALAFDVPLPAPPRSVEKLRLIEGRLSAVAPTNMLHFRFASLDQLEKASATGPARQQRLEGITCKVTRVTLAADRWTVQVALDTPRGGDKLESFQSWVVNNEMVLESTDGKKRLAASSYVLESASERRAVISYHFVEKEQAPAGKPDSWKLTYTAPAALVTLAIPFQFKDVPLP